MDLLGNSQKDTFVPLSVLNPGPPAFIESFKIKLGGHIRPAL